MHQLAYHEIWIKRSAKQFFRPWFGLHFRASFRSGPRANRKREFEQANLQKFKCPAGCPGDVEASI